jgi:surfactin family lipopeptide synthetase A
MKLTLPQQDVYFEQLLYPDDPIYNIGAKIVITGSVVYEVMNTAYQRLILQHDAYRSVVKQEGTDVRIEITDIADFALAFKDFSKGQDADQKALDFMQKTFTTAFDFGKEQWLHQFILIKVAEKRHYLFSMYHHIITDGWGTSLMFQRLVKNYNELVETGTIQSEYPYTYRDFVADDLVYQESEAFQKDKHYWKEKFEQLPEPLFERKDASVQRNESDRKTLIVQRETYHQLEQLAKANRCSTFHVILGSLFLYFGRKHQQKDIAIGLPVLNRGKSIFKKTVGLFMGVNALRISLDFDMNFTELIGAIRQQLRQDYRYQRFPLGKLIQELGAFQEKDKLFNITLSYEKQNYADHFSGTNTKVLPMTHQSERVALALYIREFDAAEAVNIDFDYNLNYFDETEIAQVVAHIEQLIHKVGETATLPLKEYNYLTSQEEKQLLETFNNTYVSGTEKRTVIDHFAEKATMHPDRVAVKDDSVAYTYSELDELSNAVRNNLLLQEGTLSDVPVAVMMPRSADLIVALLGIMKAGKAYIPLDPAFPKERLQYIVKNSGVHNVLYAGSENEQPDFGVPLIAYKNLCSQPETKGTIPQVELTPATLAYIIYTSGSTGNPKGVAIPHSALINFLQSIQQTPGIQENELLFSVTTQSFDISILEFFTPLISGASVYMASKELLLDPLQIIKKLNEVQPTIIQATPSFYQMLFNAGWKGNSNLKVLCGGDVLSAALAEKILQHCAVLWNMYGPTETTIWSSCKKIENPADAANIGSPIRNKSFYILDADKKLLPVGVPGAIYIGGKGLAKGYYKNMRR